MSEFDIKKLEVFKENAKKLENPDFELLKQRIERDEVGNMAQKNKKRFFAAKQWVFASAAVAVVALVIAINPGKYFMNPETIGTEPTEPKTESGMEVKKETEPKTDIIAGTDAVQQDGIEYQAVYDALKSYMKEREMLAEDNEGGMGGGTGPATGADFDFGAKVQEAAPAEAATATDTEVEANDYGETNTQTAGVDEADILKNDGVNLYTLSSEQSYHGYSNMVSVTSADKMIPLSQITFTKDDFDAINEMYVTAGQMVLIGNAPYENNSWEDIRTKVSFYKIGANGNLSHERDFFQDGSYETSRVVNNTVYVVTQKWVSEKLYNEGGITEDNVSVFVPSISTGADGAKISVPENCIAIMPRNEDCFVTVSAMSLNDEKKYQVQSVLAMANTTVYASQSNLYVFSSDYWGDKGSSVIKFKLSEGGVEHTASGKVPGYVKDQFSMDEYDGNLRIAAERWKDDGNQENRVYVYDENLEQIGKSKMLAPDENIKSVRFMGEMAYVVTFRQTDPLFALDMSDPTSPTILGELKIPGFSTYMHPMDDETLIGIGYSADEETGITTGIKFSLFDVSDPANPIEHSKFTIEGDCYSSALDNHKAVTYLTEKNLLVVPLSVYGTLSRDDFTISKSGEAVALVLSVTKEGGFEFKGVIDNEPGEDENAGMYFYDPGILRTTYIGDIFYTFSNNKIVASDMETLEALGIATFFERATIKDTPEGDMIIEPREEDFDMAVEPEEPDMSVSTEAMG